MGAYVDMAYVKLIGSMPAGDIDEIEARFPGIFAATATSISRIFDGRLMKRYQTPVPLPAGGQYPESLRANVAYAVAARLWIKRGYNPDGPDSALIALDGTNANVWLTEAVNGKDALIELPLLEGAPTDVAGVIKGGPLACSQQSPYSWTDDQIAAIDGGGR